MKQRFYIGEVLALVSGLHEGGARGGELQAIYNFVQGTDPPGGGMFSQAKKRRVLEQLPQLADWDDLSEEDHAFLKNSQRDPGKAQDIIRQWVARQAVKHHGAFFELEP